MNRSKKPLAVLSTAAVAGLIVAAVTSPVSAKTTALAVNGKDSKVYEYDFAKLKASAVAYAVNGSTSAEAALYNHFMTNKSSMKAFYDDVKAAYVDSAVVNQAAVTAKLEGKAFVLDTFTSAASTATTTVTTAKVTAGTDGTISVGGDTTPTEVTVSSVSAINNTTVEVTFDKAVTAPAVADFVFDNGLTVSAAAVKATDTKTVVLTTSAQTDAKVYALNYKGQNTGKTFVGVAAALKVTDVQALNLRQVKVTYNNAVNKATAENLANYTFNGGIVLTVGQASAALETDGKSVVITIDNRTVAVGQEFVNPKDYRLTVEGVTDTNGNLVQKITKDFTAKDETLPVALGASTLEGSNAEIHIKFSEPIDPNPANLGGYDVVANDVAVAGVVASASTTDPCEVILTTPNGFPVGTLNVSYTGGARDMAGLQALPINLGDVISQGQTAVTKLSDVIAQDENTVLVKFSNPISVPAVATPFYWNRTGVATDNIAANQGTNVTRVDSYTLKVEFTGTHRLPKSEDVYVFANSAVVTDTTGNFIAPSNTQSFKVNATAAAPATMLAARAVQNTGLVVTFDKVMNNADLQDRSLYTIVDKDGNVVGGRGTDSLGHPTGTLTPDASNLSVTIGGLNLASGNYTLKIKDLKDGNDNKITSSKAFTVADVTAPVVTRVSATDDVDGTYDSVYVEFNEIMDPVSLVDPNNYEFNTAGAGLVKLSEDPTYVSIAPANNNKGALIKFERASATVEGRTYRIRNVKDLAGNAMTETAEGATTTAVINTSDFDINANVVLGSLKRVDGKTFKFDLPRHLSYIEKSDFTIGRNGVASSFKVPASISYVNNATDADGNIVHTSTVTVVAQDDLGLTTSVDIVASALAKVSKDALGNPFDTATHTLNYAAALPVSDAPAIQKAYVVDATHVAVVFNKPVTVNNADFSILDPSSATPTTPIAIDANVGASNIKTLTLHSALTSPDAIPTLKVASLANTQDTDGQKLTGGQTITTTNFFATNVRLVDADSSTNITKGDYIEITFNKAIDPSTLITDKNFSAGGATAWDGTTDLTLAAGDLIFVDNTVSGNDGITITNNPQFGAINLGATTVVAGNEALGAGGATMSLSADGKTLKIKFNNDASIPTANVVEGNIINATYTPNVAVASKDTETINTAIAPQTVTNFGGDLTP